MATRKHSKPVNIREINIKFSTEEQCLEYVEQMRWPDGIVRCPTCGSTNVKKVRRGSTSKNKRPWFYLCLEKTCHQQFSPTAGTLFADSHLPLALQELTKAKSQSIGMKGLGMHAIFHVLNTLQPAA